MAQKAGEGHVAGHLPGGAFAGILQVVGHEAAIDEREAAVGEAKGRDDVKSRTVFVVQRVEVDLAIVQQLAFDLDARVLDIAAQARPLLGEGQRHGSGVLALGDGADQALLPLEPAHLPVAERNEERKAGERGEGRP